MRLRGTSVLDLKFAHFWIERRANFRSKKHTRRFKGF